MPEQNLIPQSVALDVDPELEGPDRALIEETLEFTKARKPLLDKAHKAYLKAFDAFDMTECQIKIELGQFLFEKFFNNQEIRFEKNAFQPYKAKTYEALANDSEWPFKRSTVRNMLDCAAQAKWFRSQRISTDHLSFTHQVRLTRIPNDDSKKELVRRIRAENMSTRNLEHAINGMKQTTRLGLPDTFNEILFDYSGWISPFLETTFIEDLTKAKNKEPLSQSRRKEMRETVDEIISKFVKVLGLLVSARAALKKPREIGSQSSPESPEPNQPSPTLPA